MLKKMSLKLSYFSTFILFDKKLRKKLHEAFLLKNFCKEFTKNKLFSKMTIKCDKIFHLP